MEYVTLNNGIKMPKLGYGVYQVSNEECERCVLDAISVGYRSIDTAQSYGNEEAVGNAINKCGVPREELFITTKVWITNGGYEKAKESLEESLRKLQSVHGTFQLTMSETFFTKLLQVHACIKLHQVEEYLIA